MNIPRSRQKILSSLDEQKIRVQKFLSRLFSGAILAIIALLPAIIFFPNILSLFHQQGQAAQTAAATCGELQITQAHNGEPIGISDGCYAFDIDRIGGRFKREAANRLKAQDIAGALSAWQQAIGQDPRDAEARIYLENQHVLASGNPYITLVIGTVLTGPNRGVGESNLQGAYVAQKEYNTNFSLPSHHLVRMLVANAGSYQKDAAIVARLISHDTSIVGVIGWPFSDQAMSALSVQSKANIPLISYASSDTLAGNAPHFFHISASPQQQASLAAAYARETLHATYAVVFVDTQDSYSQSMAKHFAEQFGNTSSLTYTVGQGASVSTDLQTLLNSSPLPGLIYFAGYASDASVLLAGLPIRGPLSTIPVLGPDALYELEGYQDTAYPALAHLRLTAFAYPDEWDILGSPDQKPKFFVDYASIFDHDNHHPGEYGYSRADADVMLLFDGVAVALAAANNALSTESKQGITPGDLESALTKITTQQNVQGTTGQISFDANGDAVNKELLVLCLSQNRTFHLYEAIGQFLKKGYATSRRHLTADCF